MRTRLFGVGGVLCGLLVLNPAWAEDAAPVAPAPEVSPIPPPITPGQAQAYPDLAAVCVYDFKFCGLLIDGEGKFIGVSDAAAEVLTRYRPEIKAAAAAYGIPELSLAGAVAADTAVTPIYESSIREATLKWGQKPPTADELAKSDALPLIVHTDTAFAVEKLAAATEKRPERKEEEVGKQLGTARGSIYYGAAIIRDAIDTYGRYGEDISGRPEIQATLYNLGKVEDKAKSLQTRKLADPTVKPRQNFFGLYLTHNTRRIQELLAGTGAANPAPSSDVCAAEGKSALAQFAAVEDLKKKIATGGPSLVKTAKGFAKGALAKKAPPFEILAGTALAGLCPPSVPPELAHSGTVSCAFKADPATNDGVDVKAFALRKFELKSGDSFELCEIQYLAAMGNARHGAESCVQITGMGKVSTAAVVAPRYKVGRRSIWLSSQEGAPEYLAQAIPFGCLTRVGASLPPDAAQAGRQDSGKGGPATTGESPAADGSAAPAAK